MPRIDFCIRLSGFRSARHSRLCAMALAVSALATSGLLAAPATTVSGTSWFDGPPASVAELKSMQQQIQAVAQLALNSTVAVRVGPAFGSGVVVSEDGYVVTAAHVIGQPGKTVEIRFSDGRRVQGKTLGVNRTADAGLIKIQGEGPWPFVSMGKSADLKPGQWCLATGHPGGYEQGRGPVVRLGRVLTQRADYLSSDCPLIGGDSGGPLFDLDGNVIAVHSRIADPLTANIHVPIDRFQVSWDRLAKGDAWGLLPGTIPFVGVHGDPDSDKAVVIDLVPGSPAQQAGLKPGDRVVRFGNRAIGTFSALVAAVREREPGDRVVVEVLRGEEKLELTVVVGVRGE